MKKRTKLMIGLSLAFGAALTLGACAMADTTHQDLIADGYTVLVTYDLNGGYFGTNPNLQVKHRYPEKELESGLRLVEPGDTEILDKYLAGTSGVDRGGYLILGWYRSMEDRVDGAGRPLDENGELCSVTGKPQGHVFSGRWDFAEDRCTYSDVEKSGKDYTLKLYAAWAPRYTFEFYRQKTAEELAAEQAAEPGKEVSQWLMYGSTNSDTPQELPVPAWSEETGALEYGTMPAYEGHTLDKMYTDEALTQQCSGTVASTGVLHNSGEDDNGTAENMIVRLYTTWKEGEWYHIKTAAQLADNFSADGCFEIEADLNFLKSDGSGEPEQIDWAGGGIEFSGILHGNGHTVSNIVSVQDRASDMVSGGVFGSIAASAEVTDVKFENVRFEVESVSYTHRNDTAYYCLFAGTVEEEATVTGVTVSGMVCLGTLTNMDDDSAASFEKFRIGLVSGNGVNKGISFADVGVEVLKVIVDYDDDGRSIEGWFVQATVGENGILSVGFNPDTSKDPNQQEN